MNELDPAKAIALADQWGPCLRDIIGMLLSDSGDARLLDQVKAAALDMIRMPPVSAPVAGPYRLTGDSLSVFFMVPSRKTDSYGRVDYGKATYVVPTPFLAQILDSRCQCQWISTYNLVRLFDLL